MLSLFASPAPRRCGRGSLIADILIALVLLPALGALCLPAHAQRETPQRTDTDIVTDIVTMRAGYIAIRNPKNLAPLPFLFVDLSSLDTKRYRITRPGAPQTYFVSRAVSRPKTHSQDYEDAAAAMGTPSVANAPNPSFKVGSVTGDMGVSAASPSGKDPRTHITPLPVDAVEMVGPTARVFLRGVRHGDKLDIRLRNIQEQIGPETLRPVDLVKDSPISVKDTGGFRIEPTFRYISSQKLTNGSRKSVTQVPILIEDPSLHKTENTNYYARSDSLFSNDSRDPQAVFNLTYGAESNIAGKRQLHSLGLNDPNHLLRGHTELRFDASQSVENIAFTLDTGLTRRVGGGGPDPLWDAMLRSENAAVFSLDGFVEQRLRRDTSTTPRHAGMLNPGLSFGLDAPPINLIASSAQPGPLQFLVGGKTWLLPFEKGAHGLSGQIFEYSVHLGVLVPLPRILGGARRVRLEYVDGATPASGFFRSQSFQVTLEGLAF